jgi:hypothetical protein
MGLNFNYVRTSNKVVIQLANANVLKEIKATENSIYEVLGLEPVIITFLHTAPHVLNLIYTTGIYISLNNSSNDNIDTGKTRQSSPCLIRIPISQPTNTYLQFFTPIGFKNVLSTSVLNQIDLSILDDNRNPLELSDSTPWVVVLRIDFEKTIVETVQPTKIQLRRKTETSSF